MPVTYIPAPQPREGSDSFSKAMEALLGAFVQREQNKIAKEQLQLQQQQLEMATLEAKARAQERQGAGIAGQGIMQLLMADPQIAQMVQSQQPQTMVNPQAVAQQAVAGIRGQAAPTGSMQSMANATPDARMIPGNVAAEMAPRLQQFQQGQAELARTRSDTSRIETQTRREELAITQAEQLFPIQLQEAELSLDERRSGIAANNEVIATQRATRLNLATQNAQEDRRLFTELTPTFGPAYASIIAFGTPTPPSQEELTASALQRIGLLEEAARTQPDARAAYASLANERARTEVAQRIGMAPEDQNFIDQAISRLGFTRTYEMAREAVGQEGSMIGEEELPVVAAYLKTQFRDFVIPPEDIGFFRRWAASRATPPANPAPPRSNMGGLTRPQ
jgi:hypothetical protein